MKTTAVLSTKLLLLILLACVTLITACSADTNRDGDRTGNEIDCAIDELYNPRTGECVRSINSGPEDEGDVEPDAPDASEQDVEFDIGPDTSVDADEPIDPSCDKDGDGALAIECGGNDCDDNDPLRSPYRVEVCNGIDDNCNGAVDEGLDCTFYAHTSSGLYRINPFEGTANKESDLVDPDGLPISVLDIDTHPNGSLYGITRTHLHIFNDFENDWVRVTSIAGISDANGMAIDFDGVAYVTSEDDLFKLDLSPVEAILRESGLTSPNFSSINIVPEQIQITGGNFYSSGDCVVNKENTLFMTSKHDPAQDHLIVIDRFTGAGTQIGPIGFPRVFGLTAAWGQLYGTTVNGELISIDRQTGAGTLLHRFANKRWYGTASTPAR